MGTLAVAAGTLMIIRGENGYSCAALGALAAADCMLKIRTAREARSFGLHSWPALLLTALLAAAGGVVLGFGVATALYGAHSLYMLGCAFKPGGSYPE